MLVGVFKIHSLPIVQARHRVLARREQHLPRHLHPGPGLLVRRHRPRLRHRRARVGRHQRERPAVVVVLRDAHPRGRRRPPRRVHAQQRHPRGGAGLPDRGAAVLVQRGGGLARGHVRRDVLQRDEPGPDIYWPEVSAWSIVDRASC